MIRGRAKRRLAGVAALVASALAAPAAHASTFTWSGEGFDQRWSDASNWQGHEAPTAADGTVELDFPLAACTPFFGCPGSEDDIPGLTAGTLTLANRVIAHTPKEPLEPPPAEPGPASYSLWGTLPVTLMNGLDVVTTVVGEGAGIASRPTMVGVPIALGAANSWYLGRYVSVAVTAAITGAHPLTIVFASGLQLEASEEVGPVTLEGYGPNPYVTVGQRGAGGDLNSIDGQPVTVDHANFSGSADVGPLTITDGALSVGFPGGGGDLRVHGSLTLGTPSAAHFFAPPPGSGSFPRLLATQHVDLGSTTLGLGLSCATAGQVFTLVEAGEGVSGHFTDQHGARISSGQVIAVPSGCESPTSDVPARIDYAADRFTATVLAGESPPLPGSPPPTAQVAAGALAATSALPPRVTAAALRASLARQLAAAGTNLSARWLLKRGAWPLRLSAPEAGVATVTWTAARAAHRAADGTHSGHPLLASGTVTFRSAGSATVRVRLTRAGRAVLARRRHVAIAVRVTFAPPGEAPVIVGRTLSVRR